MRTMGVWGPGGCGVILLPEAATTTQKIVVPRGASTFAIFVREVGGDYRDPPRNCALGAAVERI